MQQYIEFVTGKYKEHTELTPHQARILDWTTGLSGEAGEVCELVKHHIFSGEELDKMKLAKEIGDVVWYLTALADTNGIDMLDTIHLNMAKLQHRHGKAYSDETSRNRHSLEEKFEDTAEYKQLRQRILGDENNG